MEAEKDKDKKYKYTVDGKHGESNNPIVTEAELRQTGNVPSDYEIYLEVKGPGDDMLVKDKIDISKPGREKFYSSKPNTNNG